MSKKVYIIATIRPWNIKAYRNSISKYPGNWHLITAAKDLTLERIKRFKPRYIFFPHWSKRVPSSIVNSYECVCFHETDVPFGRGGSPLQNLIVRGFTNTKISALRMTGVLDAGPVYFKRQLSLRGRAQDIYIRSSKIIAKMIKEIIMQEPKPVAQQGKAVMFLRRRPDQSKIALKHKTLGKIYDHIRMLDADEYPKAFIEQGGLRYEFSHPVMREGALYARAKITQSKSRRGK
ncbi:MAG: methionyl-tRNA formyltransferase [Candidatus Omnitrophota bacterium]|jgi:methionyl-tRNA formyltransferase